jgi:hypothetical protein
MSNKENHSYGFEVSTLFSGFKLGNCCMILSEECIGQIHDQR